MSSKFEELKRLKEQLNISVTGLENYPGGGYNLIISNHCSLMDIFYLPVAIPEECISVISSRLAYKSNIERLQMINKYLNVMPLEVHAGAKYTSHCMQSISELLKSGCPINIFPQGAYLNDDGVIYRGRTGAARILFSARCSGTKINLIPVAIDLIDKKDDLDSYNIDCNSVKVSILEPINYDEYFYAYINTDNEKEKNVFLHAVVDTGMEEIAKSLNKGISKEYMEIYKRKDIILPDGSVIDIKDANEEKYYQFFCQDIDKREEEFKRKLVKKI